MRSRIPVFAFLLLLLIAPAAHAKSYSADRYDARIQVLPGGAVEVTETVVFRFDGTFTEVFRQIPRRRTDGIEVLRASMDGMAFTPGKAAGHYDLSNDNGLRVRWHFSPVSNSIHTFELTYVARGVVQQSSRGDLFEWRALPERHDYAIAASTVEIELPAAPAVPAGLRTNRTTSARVGNEDTAVVIHANGIRSNGWIEASILMPAGSAIDAPPAWQMRATRARAMAPTWLIAAAAVLGIGLVVLFALRQGYDAPHREHPTEPTGPDLPDALPPAIAGTLVSNGRAGLESAMATLFTLAERGELTIVENPKRWGQRSFELRRTPAHRPLADYEQVLVDAVFTGRGPEEHAELGRARGRVMRTMRRFSKAVEREMIAEGLIDEGRLAVRRRFAAAGVAALLAGGLALIVSAVGINIYGAWPLAIPGALGTVGVVAFIMYAAHTPLSNEGIRRARAWRGLQKYLRQVTRDRASIPGGVAGRLLPFAVATGLAAGWGAYLKKHAADVPPWFQALASDPGGQAFAYFVSTGGASHSGHGGVAGGGAAGGGASGAH